MLKNTWKKKVKALLEGLEIEHVERFMIAGKTGDYRLLGEKYVEAVKRKINKVSSM